MSPTGPVLAPPFYVNGNATIQAGGGIIADGGGYSAGQEGSGAGAHIPPAPALCRERRRLSAGMEAQWWQPGRAAAHRRLRDVGGAGSAGGTYGTVLVGGAGGGAINLTVTGTLEVDGRISAGGRRRRRLECRRRVRRRHRR